MIWDLGKISSGWVGPARRFQTLLPTSSNHSIITYPTLVLGKVSDVEKPGVKISQPHYSSNSGIKVSLESASLIILKSKLAACTNHAVSEFARSQG